MASHLESINLHLNEDGQKTFYDLQKWLEGPVVFDPHDDYERCTNDNLAHLARPLLQSICYSHLRDMVRLAEKLRLQRLTLSTQSVNGVSYWVFRF